MSRRPRYNAHPDKNQREIIGKLEDAYFLVINVSRSSAVGDILTWGWDVNLQCRRWGYFEIKTEEGELTDTQRAFMEQWPGAIIEIETAEDVLRDYGQL